MDGTAAEPGVLKVTRIGNRLRWQLRVGLGKLVRHVSEANLAQLNPRVDLDSAQWFDQVLANGVTRAWAMQVPLPVALTLASWANSETANGLLCVEVDEPELIELPWELLGLALEIDDLLVARVSTKPVEHSFARRTECCIMLAGWPSASAGRFTGLRRELASLASVLNHPGVEVATLLDHPFERLPERILEREPAAIHLARLSTRSGTTSGVEVALRRNGRTQWLSPEKLASVLSTGAGQARFVLLNGSATGAGLCGDVCARMGAIAAGWYGRAAGPRAADFAVHVYARLLAGGTVAEAVGSFQRTVLESGPVLSFPTLWLPHRAASTLTLKGAWPPDVGHAIRRPTHRAKHDRPAALGLPSVTIRLAVPSIMNAAFAVNGKHIVEGLVVRCPVPMENVSVETSIEAGEGRSTVQLHTNLRAGTNPIDVSGWRFPWLDELVRQGRRRCWVNVTVLVVQDGRTLSQVTRSVRWLAPNEWVDTDEAWPYIPAYVKPHDDGVVEVMKAAQSRLSTLSSESKSFNGYGASGRSADVDLQVAAIYTELRDRGIRYASPAGGSLHLPGSLLSSGQWIRTPAEMLHQEVGTCLDLVLLLAGCVERIGMHPLVILLRGHALLGWWRTRGDADRFWLSRRPDPMYGPGGRWLIRDLTTVTELVEQQSVRVMETTWVADKHVDQAHALSSGRSKLLDASAEMFDVAVDVARSRPFVQPL